MDSDAGLWFVVVTGVLAANLPFVSERAFAVLPYRRGAAFKPLWFRVVELLLLYGVTLVIGRSVEASIGPVAPQEWQFYAVTGCLFIVAAYPGYVLRYLRRRHAPRRGEPS